MIIFSAPLRMSKKQLNFFDLDHDRGSAGHRHGYFPYPYGGGKPDRNSACCSFSRGWSVAALLFAAASPMQRSVPGIPVTGGYYKIFSYGYHPSLAFAINCIILISNAGSMARGRRYRRRIYLVFFLW